MAQYDFYCKTCDRVEEHKASYETVDAGWECPCGSHMEYLPSFTRPGDAQNFSPVVIHRDALGNIRYPGSADAPVPLGYEKVELRDLHSVRKFEAEVNSRDLAQSVQFSEAQKSLREGQLKENRRVMDGLVKNFTPRGKRFYDQMREVSEKKSASGHNRPDPSFFVEAFSQNSSNREDHRDAASGWTRNRK